MSLGDDNSDAGVGGSGGSASGDIYVSPTIISSDDPVATTTSDPDPDPNDGLPTIGAGSTSGSGGGGGGGGASGGAAGHRSKSCVSEALLEGGFHIGLDLVGLIPEGGIVSRTIGNAFNYRGIVADQFGNKTVGAFQMAAAIIGTGSAVKDMSSTRLGAIQMFTGLGGIANALAGGLPVVGQVISGISLVEDAVATAQAWVKCNE